MTQLSLWSPKPAWIGFYLFTSGMLQGSRIAQISALKSRSSALPASELKVLSSRRETVVQNCLMKARLVVIGQNTHGKPQKKKKKRGK